MSDSVVVGVVDQIATLTINRPAVRNALDKETVGAISAALRDLAARDDVGVLVITGGGDKVFVSGADIRQMRERRRDDGLAAINSSVREGPRGPLRGGLPSRLRLNRCIHSGIGSNGVRPNIINTGMGPLTSFALVRDIEISTLISGHAALLTLPTMCCSMTGTSHAIPSRVSSVVHATEGTSLGIRP